MNGGGGGGWGANKLRSYGIHSIINIDPYNLLAITDNRENYPPFTSLSAVIICCPLIFPRLQLSYTIVYFCSVVFPRLSISKNFQNSVHLANLTALKVAPCQFQIFPRYSIWPAT